MDRVIRLHERFTPFPAVLPACNSQARFLCLVAGRRGGKTRHGAEIFLERIYGVDYPRVISQPYNPGAAGLMRHRPIWWARRPRLHYWVVAEVTDLLKEAQRCLLDAIPPDLIEHIDGPKNRWWLKGDVLVEFKSAKEPKRLVSAGLNGMWLEEASRIRADAWVGFLRPALADKGGWCLVTGTPLGRDWVFRDFVTPARDGEPGYEFFTWKTADNPMPHIQAEVAQAKRTLPDQFFRREYEASFEAFIGQILNEFDRAKCVVDKLPDGTVFTRGAGGGDWGFSAPGCLLVGGYDTKNVLWIVEEVYDTNHLIEDFWLPEAQRMQKKWGVTDWVGDPESPDNIARMCRGGIRMRGHRNYGSGKFDEHNRSILAGIRIMATLIHQGRFKILKSCKNLIEEIENYVWDTAAGGALQLDRPKPNQKDHAVDTCRYIVTSLTRESDVVALA